jgi:hypothetical protein
MSATASVALGPRAYAAWRSTALGAVTERLELRTILGRRTTLGAAFVALSAEAPSGASRR